VTDAALGPHHNVEMCVARIERIPTTGWRISQTTAPNTNSAPEVEQDQTDTAIGVLCATLLGDEVSGSVIGAFPLGKASIFVRKDTGFIHLGITFIAADGQFSFESTDFQQLSWGNYQLILQRERPLKVSFHSRHAERSRADSGR